jgi:hypothetical protein
LTAVSASLNAFLPKNSAAKSMRKSAIIHFPKWR